MNTNSTTPRPCAGCNRDLGFVMRTFAITYDGWRYEVCGHTNGCADRLMARLSQGSTTATSATNDTVRVFGVVEVMNGVFDFTKIPDEYHVTVVSNLLRSRLSLTTWERLQTTESFPPAAGPSTPAAALATKHHSKPWWKFWSST